MTVKDNPEVCTVSGTIDLDRRYIEHTPNSSRVLHKRRARTKKKKTDRSHGMELCLMESDRMESGRTELHPMKIGSVGIGSNGIGWKGLESNPTESDTPEY